MLSDGVDGSSADIYRLRDQLIDKYQQSSFLLRRRQRPHSSGKSEYFLPLASSGGDESDAAATLHDASLSSHSYVLYFVDVCHRYNIPEEIIAQHALYMMHSMKDGIEMFHELHRKSEDAREARASLTFLNQLREAGRERCSGAVSVGVDATTSSCPAGISLVDSSVGTEGQELRGAHAATGDTRTKETTTGSSRGAVAHKRSTAILDPALTRKDLSKKQIIKAPTRLLQRNAVVETGNPSAATMAPTLAGRRAEPARHEVPAAVSSYSVRSSSDMSSTGTALTGSGPPSTAHTTTTERGARYNSMILHERLRHRTQTAASRARARLSGVTATRVDAAAVSIRKGMAAGPTLPTGETLKTKTTWSSSSPRSMVGTNGSSSPQRTQNNVPLSAVVRGESQDGVVGAVPNLRLFTEYDDSPLRIPRRNQPATTVAPRAVDDTSKAAVLLTPAGTAPSLHMLEQQSLVKARSLEDVSLPQVVPSPELTNYIAETQAVLADLRGFLHRRSASAPRRDAAISPSASTVHQSGLLSAAPRLMSPSRRPVSPSHLTLSPSPLRWRRDAEPHGHVDVSQVFDFRETTWASVSDVSDDPHSGETSSH